MPSGAKARGNSSNYGTAKAVPFQGTKFSRGLFRPVFIAPRPLRYGFFLLSIPLCADKKMPSGAKARGNSSNYGTAEAVPFQGTKFSRGLFRPVFIAPRTLVRALSTRSE